MRIKDVLIPPQQLEDLLESLGYIPTDLSWRDDIGRFSVNGEKFVATVRPASANEEQTFAYFFNPIPRVGNVDFAMVIETGTTQDTTGLMRASAFKVFGAVAHVAAELTKKHEFQILLCVAKRKHSPTNFENRVRAYEVIVDRLSRNNGMNYEKLYSTENETVFVVYNYDLQDGIIAVKEHLSKHLK